VLSEPPKPPIADRTALNTTTSRDMIHSLIMDQKYIIHPEPSITDMVGLCLLSGLIIAII
jgi:methylmalonyl-CoA mutase N-terminal domain/subunit